LTGGSATDHFVFDTAGNGVATVTDFVFGTDMLDFSAANFGGGLIAGQHAILVTTADAALAEHAGPDGYFISGNAGADAATLLCDATGGDGADAVAIATLQGVTTLQASDLHIV